MGSPRHLRDIIFADERLLDRYVEQIRNAFGKSKSTEVEASFSLAGPSVKASKTTERVPLKTHEKIELLEVYLGVKKDLVTSRPVALPEPGDYSDPRFVVETMHAGREPRNSLLINRRIRQLAFGHSLLSIIDPHNHDIPLPEQTNSERWIRSASVRSINRASENRSE